MLLQFSRKKEVPGQTQPRTSSSDYKVLNTATYLLKHVRWEKCGNARDCRTALVWIAARHAHALKPDLNTPHMNDAFTDEPPVDTRQEYLAGMILFLIGHQSLDGLEKLYEEIMIGNL